MNEKVFAQWAIIKTTTTQYWEFTKLSIKTDEFIEFLNTYSENGWVNLNLKTSKSGDKKYLELDTWKPNGEVKATPKKEVKKQNEISIEDIPFK